MTEPVSAARPWPIGIHLRFKLDAALQPQYEALRGSPVLVIGKPRLTHSSEGAAPSYRQDVYAYALGRIGAALPSQLEPIPANRPTSAPQVDQHIED